MSHGHHHHHTNEAVNANTAFIAGIIFNFLFVVVEAVTGFYIHSLSLLSDAGHNLTDVGALAISLLAFRLLKVKPSKQYTYGYRKMSVLAALLNGVLLLITIGAISYEAVQRLFHTQPVDGKDIAIVAGIGIVVNAGTALLFFRSKNKDLNIKSAYLHMVADALVSLAIVTAGIIIQYTGWYWLDSLFSLIVAIVILKSTWSLLIESLRLSLDGVPADIDIEQLKAAALNIQGVKQLHHLHVWAISTTQNALTAHIVVNDDITMQQMEIIKQKLKHDFEHLNVQHSTLEVETEAAYCKEKVC